MAHRREKDQHAPGFRRRLPLELTPEEAALLDAAAPRYGSMRAALVAGLRTLAETSDAAQRATKAEAARDAALAETEQLRVELARQQQAHNEQSDASSRLEAESERADQLEEQARWAIQRGGDLEDEVRAAEDRIAELESARRADAAWRVDELHCPRCGEWVPQAGWALRAAKAGGALIYHEPCGYHEGSVVTPSSILGFRRG